MVLLPLPLLLLLLGEQLVTAKKNRGCFRRNQPFRFTQFFFINNEITSHTLPDFKLFNLVVVGLH